MMRSYNEIENKGLKHFEVFCRIREFLAAINNDPRTQHLGYEDIGWIRTILQKMEDFKREIEVASIDLDEEDKLILEDKLMNSSQESYLMWSSKNVRFDAFFLYEIMGWEIEAMPTLFGEQNASPERKQDLEIQSLIWEDQVFSPHNVTTRLNSFSREVSFSIDFHHLTSLKRKILPEYGALPAQLHLIDDRLSHVIDEKIDFRKSFSCDQVLELLAEIFRLNADHIKPFFHAGRSSESAINSTYHFLLDRQAGNDREFYLVGEGHDESSDHFTLYFSLKEGILTMERAPKQPSMTILNRLRRRLILLLRPLI